jgi:hypothetical protein
VTTIRYPAPRIIDAHEELPPELKLIGDETKRGLLRTGDGEA